MPIIPTLITLALNHAATTYGYNEVMCCDPTSPCACDASATTASGLPFNPDAPHVALHVPPELTTRLRIRPGRWYVCVRDVNGQPVMLPITDKRGKPGGLDLSPGALRVLGITPSRYWSGKLTPC